MGKKKRNVQYEDSLVIYVDILGFRELIKTKSANSISRSIRLVREAVAPGLSRTSFPEVPDDEYINFSDLSIIRIPLRGAKNGSVKGLVPFQILRMVHAQATLLLDEGILIRGGITIGPVARSYGQLFGEAIIRAYTLESKVARFPRIVIGEEVFEKLIGSPALWMHSRDDELRMVKSLLRRDFDGELFIDYLRVLADELDDRSTYPVHLDRHKRFIQQGLTQYRNNAGIASKFKWLNEYHKHTVGGIQQLMSLDDARVRK